MPATKLFKASLLFLFLLFAGVTKAQLQDTTIYYYQQVDRNAFIVDAPNADFFRIIPPFKLSDSLVEIKEFYKDGKLKFIGAALPSRINLNGRTSSFNGTCMEFFPNGKRKVITTYKDGQKQGEEYYYYPDGNPHQILKYKSEYSGLVSTPRLETFFDKKGKVLCTNSDGIAYEYDSDFNIVRVGGIKKGQKEGVWKGYITGKDSAKYILNYVKDKYVSGIGYDTLKAAHPFKIIAEDAKPPGGRFVFIDRLKRLTKKTYAPKDIDKVLDSTSISFTVLEDGSLTDLTLSSQIPAELFVAMKDALAKSTKWKPAYIYGIAVKATVGLELAVKVDQSPNGRYKLKENTGFEIHYYNGHRIIGE